MSKANVPFFWLKFFGAFNLLSLLTAMLIGPPYCFLYRAFISFPQSPFALYRFKLSILLLLLASVVFYFERRDVVLETEREKLKAQIKNFILLILGYAMFVFAFVYMAIPALLYPFAEDYNEIDGTVLAVDRSPSRRSGCLFGTEINFEQDKSLLSKVCVNKDFAREIKKGDLLHLEGWQIPKFGIYVIKILK